LDPCLNEHLLEELGQGLNSWDTVDSFARVFSGPAWLKGQISDEVIRRWASSPDLWLRRAALVSTVALNLRSYGGLGDAPRTLMKTRQRWLPGSSAKCAISWKPD
jgi:hypothetical protein